MENRSFISKEFRFEWHGLTLWFKRSKLWEEFLSKTIPCVSIGLNLNKEENSDFFLSFLFVVVSFVSKGLLLVWRCLPWHVQERHWLTVKEINAEKVKHY